MSHGGRRRRALEKRPSVQSVEDDRPLEDLLRDLGEEQVAPKVKKKALRPKAVAKQLPKAAERAQMEPRVEEVNEELEEEEEEEVSISEDGWQKVATKQARRAANKALREEREQLRRGS